MNFAFGPSNIDEIDGDTADLYNPSSGVPLSEAFMRTPNTGMTDALVEYVDAWPGALQASLKAAIHHNLTRDARVPITFAWTPAYDYSLAVHDIVDTATTRGGITVLITSRYPADTHPIIRK